MNPEGSGPFSAYAHVTPENIALAEQRHARADAMLTKLLPGLVHDAGEMKTVTGLSDDSVLFDYIMYWFFQQRQLYGMNSIDALDGLASAAITRLTRAARGEQKDDMSQFEDNLDKD